MTQLIKRLYGYYIDYVYRNIHDSYEPCIYAG